MKLSVVSTLYQSAPYIDEFYRRVTAAAVEFAGKDYEIIFVNDGSPDDSLAQAIVLSQADSHVVVVDLSRNFGHHKAIMTGLAHAQGEHVFLIDSDLEESPEWLAMFEQRRTENQCDVVYGIQEERKGNRFEKLSGDWFYRLFNFISGLDMPLNLVTARLMSRRYVEALLRHEEREVFLAGLWHITGFKQVPCVIKKDSREETTYTLRHKIALVVNSITAFSNAPLVAIFYIGLVLSLLAGSYTAYLIISWLFFGAAVEGWTSVIVSIWLLGGLIISFIGVVGIYLSKIYSETKRRPYTIVRQIYGRG